MNNLYFIILSIIVIIYVFNVVRKKQFSICASELSWRAFKKESYPTFSKIRVKKHTSTQT